MANFDNILSNDKEAFCAWFWTGTKGNELIDALNSNNSNSAHSKIRRRNKWWPHIYCVVLNDDNIPDRRNGVQWRYCKVGITEKHTTPGTHNRMETVRDEIQHKRDTDAAIIFVLPVKATDSRANIEIEKSVREKIGWPVHKDLTRYNRLPVPTEWVITTQFYIDWIRNAIKKAKKAKEAEKAIKKAEKAIEEAKKAKTAEEAIKKAEEAIEEAKKAEGAIEVAKKAEEAEKAIKKAKTAEEAIKKAETAEEAKKATEVAKKATEVAKKAIKKAEKAIEEAKKVEEAKKAEEAIEEAKKPEEAIKEAEKAIEKAKKTQKELENAEHVLDTSLVLNMPRFTQDENDLPEDLVLIEGKVTAKPPGEEAGEEAGELRGKKAGKPQGKKAGTSKAKK